jgi:hypothetical protein
MNVSLRPTVGRIACFAGQNSKIEDRNFEVFFVHSLVEETLMHLNPKDLDQNVVYPLLWGLILY